MKVAIICKENEYQLEAKVNEFIKNKNIIDIKYSIASHGYKIYHSALIMYNEE